MKNFALRSGFDEITVRLRVTSPDKYTNTHTDRHTDKAKQCMAKKLHL